jgi:hypothetical protein
LENAHEAEDKMMDENIARKPADIDPERLDNIASHIDLKLEHDKPGYTELKRSLSRKNITGANFDPNMTVPEYVRGTLKQLSTIQQYCHGRDVQKIKRSQVLQITKELFEYQLKDMQHLLLLGMDVQKKTRFIQYLETIKALQNRIQRESARQEHLR